MSSFLLLSFLFNLSFSVTTRNTANLTPNNVRQNGASITEIKTRVEELTNPRRWRLEHDTFGGVVSVNNGWYLQLSLDKSWSFDASDVSILSIEIDARPMGTSSDLLLIAFQQTGNNNYFATNIDTGGLFNNEMMPQWGTLSSYLTGNVFNIVETNTNTGAVYRSVAAGQNAEAPYSPSTRNQYSSPFTMILTNDPASNELLYSYTTDENGFTPRTCSFPAMNGDSKMNIYLAPDSLGDNIIDIYSIKVTLLSLDTAEPTNDPTKDPSTDPTTEPTTEPSVDPSVDPTNIPTNVPTLMPTYKPSSIDTLNAFNPTIANEGENKNGQETTQSGDLFEQDEESQNAETYGIIIGIVVVLVLILIGMGVWWQFVAKKRRNKQTNHQHHNMVSLSEVEVDSASPGTTKGQTLGANDKNTQSMNLGEDERESDDDALYDEDDNVVSATPSGDINNEVEEDGLYTKGDSVKTPNGNTKGANHDEDDDNDDLLYSKGLKAHSPR